MKKRLALILLFVSFPMAAYTFDFSVQYYVPTLFGISSGPAATITRFQNNDSESRFLIPFEVKVAALSFHDFTLSGNAITSFFIEDDIFSSFNLSVGASLFYNRGNAAKMSGLFISLYPLYEYPLFAFGKEPGLTWKMAADIGYSLVLFNLLQLNIFSRYMFIWRGEEFGIAPDVGITIGVHLPRRTQR